MYDTVLVPCPKCGEIAEFQSKSGDCFLEIYTVQDCPDDVLIDINRHSPCICNRCNTPFYYDIKNRRSATNEQL